MSVGTAARGDVAGAVTALFVPGDRPDRYRKAYRSPTDVVVIDLEDAVADGDKPAALRSVLTALRPGRPEQLRAMVRVNAPGTSTSPQEMTALTELTRHAGHGLLGVMLPKAEKPGQVAAAVEAFGGELSVVALIETARGVAAVNQIAAVSGLARLAFGAIDFSLDVAAETGSVVGDYARSQVVVASRASGLAGPLESPAAEITDLVDVERTSRLSASTGFTGRLCIHPAQLAAVRAGFSPTKEQILWAQGVLGAGASAVQVRGRMVDRPLVIKARRIIQLAGDRW